MPAPPTMSKKVEKHKLPTENEYDKLMQEIEQLMKKGSDALTEKDIDILQEMVNTVQEYEAHYFTLPKPNSLAGMLDLKMFEMNMSQKEMAAFLGISPSKFSLILNNKREPDAQFIKAIYRKLQIDPKFILDHL